MLRLSFFSEHKVFDTSLFSSCVREEDLKKRLKYSPDAADAAALTFASVLYKTTINTKNNGFNLNHYNPLNY